MRPAALPAPAADIAVFVVFSVPAIIMATDYCAKNEDTAHRSADQYPCDILSQMVLSMRSLATAMIYFRHRDRRCELLDFGVLYRKVWHRLRADVRWCTGAATGDGYRLQFNSEPDVLEFSPYDSVAGSSVGSVDSSGPLHSTHDSDDDGQDEDAGMPYQLMDNDDTC